MWPFKKTFYKVTNLQVGDECVCLQDHPHGISHQKLLNYGQKYIVRDVYIGAKAPDGFGGPWIRLVDIHDFNDMGWACTRFDKIVKSSILTQVLEPVEFDTEKAREETY